MLRARKRQAAALRVVVAINKQRKNENAGYDLGLAAGMHWVPIGAVAGVAGAAHTSVIDHDGIFNQNLAGK